MKVKIERYACMCYIFFEAELGQLAEGLDMKVKGRDGFKNS